MQCIKVNACDPNVTGVSAYLSRLASNSSHWLASRQFRPFFVHRTIATTESLIGAYYCPIFAQPHCERKSADSPIPMP